jgi:Tfp pilus assembly protein PilP
MSASRVLLAGAIAVLLSSPTSGRQGTPPAQPAKPPAAPAAQEPAPPTASYNREGRRDPFISLVGRAGDPTAAGVRPPGLPGILIQEVSLKGIVRQSNGFVAMVQGPDKKTYMARPGQRLLDGTVKSITQDTVVFSQDVNDPLSLVKQREVRKTLRTSEEGQG